MFPDVTVFWVVFFIFLTGVIFNGLILRPILRVVSEREGAVKSARELAESAATEARAATAEFEARIQAARSEIYREMDEKRRRALARRAELLAETRAKVETEISKARESLQNQAAVAREHGARFHTDATQVLGWEKFRIVDQGHCKYTIQTNSGFFFGLYQTSHGMLFTTRRSVISDNEKFEFVMSGLGSPPILR